MPDDRAIRAAELAKLEAVVAQHGTDGERAQLLFSGITRAGITLTTLAEAAENDQSIGRHPAEPELLAKLTRRVERRTRLKLPQAECAAEPPTPYCDCLERALDQPGNDGVRAVRKLAAAFHQRPAPIPTPAAPPAEPQEATESAEDTSSKPEPPAEPKPKPEPGRVVHRSRRWYDDSERPRLSDMRF